MSAGADEGVVIERKVSEHLDSAVAFRITLIQCGREGGKNVANGLGDGVDVARPSSQAMNFSQVAD